MKMEALDEFGQNQRVIEDFAANTLAGIRGDIGRLLHVATLRDLATGQYRHSGLEALYSAQAVDQALRICHEELFEKILESPLEKQDVDLRHCLEGFEESVQIVAANWQEHEFYRCLIPSGSPAYLRELFCSNLRMLLKLIAEPASTPRPAA
ncbi:MAG TPA: hypothetical protein VGT03_01750 [Candidatus Acidoferrales bacterium]|nr:hypothetical protein [Candidatus Acidoferrales bacterium]